MNSAVVTISVGDFYAGLESISHPTIKAYADRIGADFIVQREKLTKHIGYTKIKIILDLLKIYDRLIFVDTDLLIRHDTPNLFNVVPADAFGIFNEGYVYPRHEAKYNWFRQTGTGTEEWVKSRKYYNTGVMVVSRFHSRIFSVPTIEIDNYAEQTLINLRLYDQKTQVFELDYKFNRIPGVTQITGEELDDAYIVHFAGAFGEGSPIAENLETFRALAERFQTYAAEGTVPDFRRKFYIETAGALGDVVASEPVVRYVREVLQPRAMIAIKTDWPEVFQHLRGGAPTIILGPGQSLPDIGYRRLYLWPEPPIGNYNLMPPIDYAAFAAFQGQVPKAHRHITLTPSPIPQNELRDYVLVHPGASWQSKTFPASYWNNILAGLHAAGLKVALIGKDCDDGKGTVAVDPTGCLDLRGKHDLPGLFRAIETAPLLISNDSAPVHIAGAFDNPVLMIATCKHPDYIFPYRPGGLNVSLGSPIKAAYPAVGIVSDISMDTCSEAELQAALPPEELVVTTATRLFHARRDARTWT